eukprot:COSAG01_NODE_313_length_19043_cov_3.917177_13_plen_639_part_00
MSRLGWRLRRYAIVPQMTLLSVNNLSCTQAVKVLFKNATFSVEKYDKIAIIGRNGSGKTTLLKHLEQAGHQPSDTIAVQKGLAITALHQSPDFNPDHSISDHLNRSQSAAALAIQTYYKTLDLYNEKQSEVSEKAFTQASETMDHLNLWEYEARVASMLSELEIGDLNQKIKGLSGGMKKKIALAQTFFENADLLILDEPTNHLDIRTIEWLEAVLKRQQSAIVMVTHDRYFLDKVCNKIIEIDQEKVFVYKGGYQSYLEQRAQRYLEQEKQESRIQSLLRVELAWLKRGPKARSTKQKARKQRIDGLVNRQVAKTEDNLHLELSERRLGSKILRLKDISKSFGSHKVIQRFTFDFQKGDRIGILGPNGAGKTTLLNIIMQRLAPDHGQVEQGVNTRFAYFDQHSQDLDLDATIYEYVNEIGTYFTQADGVQVSAAKLLETFLFPSSMLKTPIKKLSGGERRRLHLVCLLLENPNFLLFDEPTNDLDIQTLAVLEDFLCSFGGVVLLISHDRYFMDRVTERLLVFNDKGEITGFKGNYSDYTAAFKVQQAVSKKEQPVKQEDKQVQRTEQADKQRKNQIKKLEGEIARLEQDKATLNTDYAHNQADINYEELGKKLKALDNKLALAMEEWEALVEDVG